MNQNTITGLVLMGGGARAAYQVGVLKALSRILIESGFAQRHNPFEVIAGTSAGAINGVALASRADDFADSVAKLVWVWENFSADQVYRADAFGVVSSGAKWLTMFTMGWALARWRRSHPKSLLDNTPLGHLLHRMIDLKRLDRSLDEGYLRAIAVTGSSYTSGRHVTFYQSRHPIENWQRTQRLAIADQITIEHLLASSAIPFVFPAQRLQMQGQPEWFGDGSMRQLAPISPAIHLGANRVLVIGAGRLSEPTDRALPYTGYPSLAQIGGHALSNIFLDGLAMDIERLQRVNATLRMLPPDVAQHTALKPVEVLVIAPSQRLDDIAMRYIECLPRPVRGMLRAVGVTGAGNASGGGAALASYLLFEKPYTRALIDLGYSDTLTRTDDVLSFFNWQ